MLLLAPDLLGESLALKLTSARDDWEVVPVSYTHLTLPTICSV